MAVDETMGTLVNHRVHKWAKVLFALRSAWKARLLRSREKMGMFVGIIILMVLYGWKSWALNAKVQK